MKSKEDNKQSVLMQERVCYIYTQSKGEVRARKRRRRENEEDEKVRTWVLSSSVVTELATWTRAVTNFIPGHSTQQYAMTSN